MFVLVRTCSGKLATAMVVPALHGLAERWAPGWGVLCWVAKCMPLQQRQHECSSRGFKLSPLLILAPTLADCPPPCAQTFWNLVCVLVLLQVSVRVMDYYQFMNSKVLFKEVRHKPAGSTAMPVMVHISECTQQHR